MRKFGGYKPYHHELDIKPIPESVIYINETWIADTMLHAPRNDVGRRTVSGSDDELFKGKD